MLQFSTSHILSARAPGPLLDSGVGAPSGLSPWMPEAEQARHPQQPSSHPCSIRPPPCSLPSGRGLSRWNSFGRRHLWPCLTSWLPFWGLELSQVLPRPRCREKWTSVLITGCLPLPMPPSPCPCDPEEPAQWLIFLKCPGPGVWGWTLRTSHPCSGHPVHRRSEGWSRGEARCLEGALPSPAGLASDQCRVSFF